MKKTISAVVILVIAFLAACSPKSTSTYTTTYKNDSIQGVVDSLKYERQSKDISLGVLVLWCALLYAYTTSDDPK